MVVLGFEETALCVVYILQCNICDSVVLVKGAVYKW